MKLLLAWTVVMLLAGFAVGMGLGRTLWGSPATPAVQEAVLPPETCVTGVVGLPDGEWGYMATFGEQELCFREMRWGPVYGGNP